MLKRYEEDNIRYYETPIGRLPSTTSVLRVLAKPALVGWAAKTTAEYMRLVLENIRDGVLSPDDLTEKRIETFVKESKSAHRKESTDAMDTGSAAHAMIEEFYKREVGAVPITPLKVGDEIEAAFDAFLAWDAENKVNPICVEERIWSVERFAGTLDLYGEVGGKPTLVDFKSSKGHWDDHVMQLGAYDMAFRERTGHKVDRYIIVRLDKTTGLPDPKEYSREDVELGGKRFLAVLNYFWLTEGAKK